MKLIKLSKLIFFILFSYILLEWSKFLGRAPTDPSDCFNACFYGCNNKGDEDD